MDSTSGYSGMTYDDEPLPAWYRPQAEHDLIRALFNSTPAITTEPDDDPDGTGWLDDDDVVSAGEALAMNRYSIDRVKAFM